MSRRASRRGALAGIGSIVVGAALDRGPARAEESNPGPDLAAVKRALAPSRDTQSVALWGSSSMEGGLATEEVVIPIYIHEELTLSLNPLPVFQVAFGALWSGHSALLRGIDTPQVHVPPHSGEGRFAVEVETDVPALWSFECEGVLSSGIHGRLTGSPEQQWFFEATPSPDGERPPIDLAELGPAHSGAFTSDWAARTAHSRHIIWVGKNNLWDLDRVRTDIHRLVESARDPGRDVMVVGHWLTKNDLDHPETINAVREINTWMARQYADRYLDIQSVLTDERLFDQPPFSVIDVGDGSLTHDERKEGIVPWPLRGSDGVHLSGWGNLAVSRAMQRKMQVLGWI